MADNSTQLTMDVDEPMQTEPIYWSGDEDTDSKSHARTRLTNSSGEKDLEHFVIQPIDPTDTIQVTVPIYDVKMPPLSSTATTESQQSKHKHNISPVTAE